MGQYVDQCVDRYVEGWTRVSLLDYPFGVCSTVFLAGCNLRCRYCHNPDLAVPGRALVRHPWELVLDYLGSNKGLLDAVCFSGGEPTLRSYLVQMVSEAKRLGLKVKVDTNGTLPEAVSRLLEAGAVDYLAIDIKAPPDKYRMVCGTDVNPKMVEQTVLLAQRSGIAYELRTTAHPLLLTTDDFEKIGKWVGGGHRYVIQPCRTWVTLDPSLQGSALPTRAWLHEVQLVCESRFSEVEVRDYT